MGKHNIDDYNKSISAEKRKKNAQKAGRAPKKTKAKTLRQLAKIINEAPVQEAAKAGLEKLGLDDKDMTNAALIVASVFRAAYEGDMKAVEKWEKYIGQTPTVESDEKDGMLADLINGLQDEGD